MDSPGTRSLSPMPTFLRNRDLRALIDIGGVVSAVPDCVAAAHEVLEVFRRIVPFAAASLQSWNPVTGRHETLANAGYPAHAVRHLDTWFVREDEAYRFMRDVNPTPVRWRDMAFDYRRLYSATEYWLPLGFDEGVTTCLYDGRGRYTGNLHLNTDSRRHPTDSARDALLVLQSMLAGLTDPLRTPSAIAGAVDPGANAAIVSARGIVISLPGCSLGRHLADGSQLALLVAGLGLGRRASRRFLWFDGEGGWHSVRVEQIDRGLLVMDMPTRLPFHLTPREVDVLTLVAEGRTNGDIAAILVVAAKTAAKHIEHLLEKLACETRTALAVRALRDGLVRVDLTTRPGDTHRPTPCEPAVARTDTSCDVWPPAEASSTITVTG